MPIIAYKTLTLNTVWVQVRRIACAHCHEPYVYLVNGNKSVTATGIPIVSSDEGMRNDVSRQLERQLNVVARKGQRGEALCPHCKRYQPWMSKRSRRKKTLNGAAIGFAIGFAASMAGVFVLTGVLGQIVFASFLVLVPVGAIAGAVIGHGKGLSQEPHPGIEDPRVMKEDEFRSHIAKCEQEQFDPTLTWYAQVGGRFLEKVPVIPLALQDETARMP